MTVDARGGLLVAAKFASGVDQKSSMLLGVGTISLALNATHASGATDSPTAQIVGAEVGDLIFVIAPNTLEDGLVLEGAAITSANTVTVAIANPTAGSISRAAREWAYLWFGKHQ